MGDSAPSLPIRRLPAEPHVPVRQPTCHAPHSGLDAERHKWSAAQRCAIHSIHFTDVDHPRGIRGWWFGARDMSIDWTSRNVCFAFTVME